MENKIHDTGKFREYLLLKKYSPATADTVLKITGYFIQWVQGEQIEELADVSHQDIVGFMQWCGKQGVSQKTIANYLTHIGKLYRFLISEGETKENPVAHVKVQGIKRKVFHDIVSIEELHQLYQSYTTDIPKDAGKQMPPQQRNHLSRCRNKVILGLLVYQGLRVEEVAALKLQDVQLRAGTITIHSQRRTAARTMQLESHQVYEMINYIQEIRKAFLQVYGASDRLFLQWQQGKNFYGVTQSMLRNLQGTNPRIKNFEQLRASVIVGWLRQYDLRKVQYMAGHRYVSSTEAYKAGIIDALQEDIAKFHPL